MQSAAAARGRRNGAADRRLEQHARPPDRGRDERRPRVRSAKPGPAARGHQLQRPRRDAAAADGEPAGRSTAVLSRTPRTREGTFVYDALSQAARHLAERGVDVGRIVMLSDGQEVGSTVSREVALDQLKSAQIRTYTIGLKSYAFDEGYLRDLADETGGEYAEATSSAELETDLRRPRLRVLERVHRPLPLAGRAWRGRRRRDRHRRRVADALVHHAADRSRWSARALRSGIGSSSRGS